MRVGPAPGGRTGRSRGVGSQDLEAPAQSSRAGQRPARQSRGSRVSGLDCFAAPPPRRDSSSEPPSCPLPAHVRSGGFGSNHGPLITVAAPGADVFRLRQSGSIEPWDGTSTAAPIVSGIAGLLLSFDNTLQANDLKSLIVDGANAGGWKATRKAGGDQYMIVNAYESLKLAAMHPGAPLCGNRIWANAGNVMPTEPTDPRLCSHRQPASVEHSPWPRTTGAGRSTCWAGAAPTWPIPSPGLNGPRARKCHKFPTIRAVFPTRCGDCRTTAGKRRSSMDRRSAMTS